MFDLQPPRHISTLRPQKGRWRLMANHLFVVVCRSNRACWRYLLRWLAHCVQHPGTAPGSVIVLRSDAEGAGKSLLLTWMTWIFGEHGIFLSDPDEFIGEFNDHLENKCFISLNEPAFPGDHRAAGKLKSMITEPEWIINGKYRRRRRVPNIAHTMMTTNREWAIPAGNKSRRFLMLDVDDARVGDDKYFTALRNEADNGGIEAMLHALLHIDLTEFNPWSVPKTAALREQQLRSSSTMVRWITDAVSAGELIPSDPRLGIGLALPNGSFGQEVPGPALYRAYDAWCRTMHERPKRYRTFGKWLSACGVTGRASNGITRNMVPDARTLMTGVFKKAGII